MPVRYPRPQDVIERSTQDQLRVQGSVSAAGKTQIFDQQIWATEIIEIIIESEGVNTFQILAGSEPETPVWNAVNAGTTYSDPGFYLPAKREINLIAGNANKIDFLIRYRWLH